MVVLHATPVLLVATAIFAAWRFVLWRRNHLDVARELGVVALFAWLLIVVRLTFFPLVIIFYDWHGASNLIPFASIVQLLRETPSAVAIDNIVGNLVLFAPLGVLLPLLFDRLRRPVPLLWRVATISLLIETVQYLTRARSVDIDDVILNTTGAMIGYGAYRIAAAMLEAAPAGNRLLQRLGSDTGREPLLLGVIPLVLTAAVVVPVMISTVVGETLSGGADGIVGVALADDPETEIAARNDIEDHTFIVAATDTPDGQRLVLWQFQKVLPGRYTWLGTAEIPAGNGSRYSDSITAFNPSAGEQPLLVVWGTNDEAAIALHVTGNGLDTTLALPPTGAFVVGSPFEPDETADILDDFDFSFTTQHGTAAGFERDGL